MERLSNRMPKYEVSAKELRTLVNPLDGKMWRVPTIEVAEVLSAQANNLFEDRIWNDVKGTIPDAEHRDFHIRRIAALLSEKSDELPVLILENHTTDIKAHLYDGNHRVAAAFVRGDEKIRLTIAASAPDSVTMVLSTAVLVP